MSKNDFMTTSISFHGPDVQATLEANPLVYKAIWDSCSTFPNSSIRIDAHPCFDDSPLEWSMSIASPAGRRTLLVTQQSAAGPVRFSKQ